MTNDSENTEGFDLPELSEDPTAEEIQQHMSIIEKQAKEELGVAINMEEIFMELAQRGEEPTLMDITDLIAEKIANAKAQSEDAIDKTPINPDELINAQFVIKVSITHLPDIWRTIVFRGGHSLSHVHLAIQKAFDFDNEGHYSFYLDNKIRNSKKSYHDPRSGNQPFTTEATLANLTLVTRQRILYLFDYDDSWEFHVDLLEITTEYPKSPYPVVLETHGDAPLQYGSGISQDDDLEGEDW
ncbi:MAG: hypothetical protein AB8F74_18680 [Saprospiraceae bacterium]